MDDQRLSCWLFVTRRILGVKPGIEMPRHTLGHRFNFGLRWLHAADRLPDDFFRKTASDADQDWSTFLAEAGTLPPPRHLWIARGWPLLALINGPLALSGLMLWPERSGVHVLLFLMIFLLVPVVMMSWSAISGLILGRSPWWGRLLLGHHDRVIAIWCARQSLRLHGLFCVAGLVWLWLMLATRQVIFYWSTSIASVSERVAELLAVLSLGVIAAPEPAAIAAAEAGAITGWRAALLADSPVWASWLSQVVVLWMLLPCLVLLILCQWRLHRGVSQWPRYSSKLNHILEKVRQPVLSFRALQPEQPVVETLVDDIPVGAGAPQQPGFGWRFPGELPSGSRRLGEQDHAADVAVLRAQGAMMSHWYISSHAVPTGDLADLLVEHTRTGATPRLTILLEPAHDQPDRLEALRHSWNVFVQRNQLCCPVMFLRDCESEVPAPAETDPQQPHKERL